MQAILWRCYTHRRRKTGNLIFKLLFFHPQSEKSEKSAFVSKFQKLLFVSGGKCSSLNVQFYHMAKCRMYVISCRCSYLSKRRTEKAFQVTLGTDSNRRSDWRVSLYPLIVKNLRAGHRVSKSMGWFSTSQHSLHPLGAQGCVAAERRWRGWLERCFKEPTACARDAG